MAGRGCGYRRHWYRCPGQSDVVAAAGNRQEPPTRFVIPAGGAPVRLVLIARCVPALLCYLSRPPAARVDSV